MSFTERLNVPLRLTLIVLAVCLSGWIECSAAALPVSADSQPLPTLAPMLEKTTPGVVNIATEEAAAKPNPFQEHPFFRRFFEKQRTKPKVGLGSGVIIDARKGYIVTNNHVVGSARRIVVKLHDGRHLEARVIGTDPEADIALLQIDAKELTQIPMADSDRLRVGDFVVAIGNPFGLGQTVTSGIVSALGRSGLGIESYEDFIQTDASINPGNSGGALVNLRGELVGINTAILGPSGGNIGIGFAIPSNMVTMITAQLAQYGEVSRGRLGVTAQDLTPELAQAFGLHEKTGVVVAAIDPGSAAAKAGLQRGDVVLSVNGKPVTSAADMRNEVGLLRPGAPLELEVLRDGHRVRLKAVVGKRALDVGSGAQISRHLRGVQLADIGEDSPYFRQVQGVVVAQLEADSEAAQAGLRKGDIIRSINRREVRSVTELPQVVKDRNGPLLLNVQRGERAMFLLLSGD